MNTNAVLALLALSSLAGPANAATVPDAAFFQSVGAKALATKAAPGIALAVLRGGQIVYEGGFGSADVSKARPVDAATPFAIGSLTKQFTATAVMMLVQDRKLSLDDRVAKFVPALPNAKDTTIKMLLNQTSGLHNYPFLKEHTWPTQGPIALSRILAILATDKPDFAPGTQWEYSNANYATLAAVVEKASGVPLARFLRQRVFAPLNMQESAFGYAAQQQEHPAIGYAAGKPEVPPLSLDLFSGAGGVISSAHDMALWDRALLNGALLPRPSVERMWTAGALSDGSRVNYAMGWVPTTVGGHREVWHNGLAPGVGGYCYNAVFPDDGLAVVVLTNGFGAQGLPERMVARIAAAYGIASPVSEGAKVKASSPDHPTIDALARAFWNQLAAGSLRRDALTPQFSAALTPALLTETQQGIGSLGKLKAMTFESSSEKSGYTLYRYALTFESGAVHHWTLAISPDRKIAGSFLSP